MCLAMIVTLYAGSLERRSAVVSPVTPALCEVRFVLVQYIWPRFSEYSPDNDYIGHNLGRNIETGFFSSSPVNGTYR